MSGPLPALFLGPTTEHVPKVPDTSLFALRVGRREGAGA